MIPITTNGAVGTASKLLTLVNGSEKGLVKGLKTDRR